MGFKCSILMAVHVYAVSIKSKERSGNETKGRSGNETTGNETRGMRL